MVAMEALKEARRSAPRPVLPQLQPDSRRILPAADPGGRLSQRGPGPCSFNVTVRETGALADRPRRS
ncbi:MAG: hypothetical protein ACLT9P_03345 [Evtepia gabavorous]